MTVVVQRSERELNSDDSSFLLVFQANRCDHCEVTRSIVHACDCGAWTGAEDAHVAARRALAQPLRDALDRPVSPSSPIEFAEAIDVLVPWIERLFAGLNAIGEDPADASGLTATLETLLTLRDRVHAVSRRRPWLAVWDPFRSLVDELIGLARIELDACMAPHPDAALQLEAVAQAQIDQARVFIRKVDVRLTWWGIERTIRLPNFVVAAATAAYEDTQAESIVDLDRRGMVHYERITTKQRGPTGIGVGLVLDVGLIDRAFDEARFYRVAASTYARLDKFRAGFLELMDDPDWRAALLDARRKFYEAQLKAETVLKHLAGERRLEAGAAIELGATVTEAVAPALLGFLVGSERSRKVARGRDYTNYMQIARQAGLEDVLLGFDTNVRVAHGHSDFVVNDDHVLLGKGRVRVDDDDLVNIVLASLESAAAMFAAIDCVLVEADHPATQDRAADFSSGDWLLMLLGASGMEPTRLDRRGDRLEISGRVAPSLRVTPLMIVATITPFLDPEVKRLTLRMKRHDASLIADVPLDSMRRFLEGEGVAKHAGLIECFGRTTINGRVFMDRRYTRLVLVMRMHDHLHDPLEQAEQVATVLAATARRLGDRDLADGFEGFKAARRAQATGVPWTPQQKQAYERLATYLAKPSKPWDGGGSPLLPA